MPLLAWLLSASLAGTRAPALPCTCVRGPPPATRRAALDAAATFDAVFEANHPLTENHGSRSALSFIASMTALASPCFCT